MKNNNKTPATKTGLVPKYLELIIFNENEYDTDITAKDTIKQKKENILKIEI